MQWPAGAYTTYTNYRGPGFRGARRVPNCHRNKEEGRGKRDKRKMKKEKRKKKKEKRQKEKRKKKTVAHPHFPASD